LQLAAVVGLALLEVLELLPYLEMVVLGPKAVSVELLLITQAVAAVVVEPKEGSLLDQVEQAVVVQATEIPVVAGWLEHQTLAAAAAAGPRTSGLVPMAELAVQEL
jgi:hypothetical protein